jgi:ribosome-associated translation inhibitor RaiA
MTTPIEIHFHGMDKSDATEDIVRQKVARLERHFDRMTYCRVSIDLPHRHNHKQRAFEVKLEIGIPGRPPIVIDPEPTYDPAHEDIKSAIKSAFDAAGRRLVAEAEIIGKAARNERGRRRPAPPSAQ